MGEAVQAGVAHLEEVAVPRPQLAAEEGGAGEGAQAQGSKLLHVGREGRRGRGRAGASEPVEVSEDTIDDEAIEEGMSRKQRAVQEMRKHSNLQI
eukprot:1162151-Pelagomonas_calceolata.AAC.17